MWSCVAPDDVKNAAPSARAKHSATLVGEHVYILGGRNGNLPTRDFWKYNLVTGKWQQLKPVGDKLPCLQEHTAVAHKESIYVFGGEVGFSAGTETPLWVYDIKANCWKKKRTKKGVATPKGRRGHTALVYNGNMLIYGGYQDLRGSCSELWAYHFDTESWHLLSGGSSSHNIPPPRHKHSAVLHSESMWIFGGMTDLQERQDLWRWDLVAKKWVNIKTKVQPGPLHSHAACKIPSGMLIFGGERNGQLVDEVWRFSFALETWEKIPTPGLKPQPRSESVAFVVSALVLNSSSSSTETKCTRVRIRSCNSADRGNRHSSYLPNNKVAPCERTYIFQPSDATYTDGTCTTDLAQQYSEPNRSSRSFLQEIQKLSQIRVSNKCSYTVLTGCAGDSTESLLKQHASPQDAEVLDTELMATPSRGTMVKSKSAYVIKKKYLDNSPTQDDNSKEANTKKKVEFDSTAVKLPRDPISVPNFASITLPTPVLTPVEATKLVYLDSDDEHDILRKETKTNETVQEKNEKNTYENFKPMKRGDSYSSHLGYADNPLYQQLINSMQENSAENVSSTSDYASIETVNRLSSASSYSVKTGTPQEENQRNKERDKAGPFGFCNPNYMGPDIKSILSEKPEKRNIVRILSNEETVRISDDEDALELQNYNGIITKDTKVFYKHSSRTNRPPKSLALGKEHHQCQIRPNVEKCRALSASRVERRVDKVKMETANGQVFDSNLPLYVYVFGGKEQGQVTVFQRPISVWRLKLF